MITCYGTPIALDYQAIVAFAIAQAPLRALRLHVSTQQSSCPPWDKGLAKLVPTKLYIEIETKRGDNNENQIDQTLCTNS